MSTAEPDKEKKPAPRLLNLQLNVDELERIQVPELDKSMFGIWEKESDFSKEYLEMQQSVHLIARYLAACVNEGPEVKDNISKRMVLTKQILEEFLGHVAINGWMLFGLISEYSHDVYADMCGTQKTLQLLRKIQKKTEERAIKNEKVYVA